LRYVSIGQLISQANIHINLLAEKQAIKIPVQKSAFQTIKKLSAERASPLASFSNNHNSFPENLFFH
jgi:hypothetical protein